MVTLQHRHPVAVIGRGNVGPETDAYQTAELLGEELGKRDLLIICGGGLGVMEAVCRGCAKAGGIAIGVLPELAGQGNSAATIVIPADLGNAGNPRNAGDKPCGKGETSRNRVVVGGSLCVFAVAGERGTANELRIAKELRKRVFGLCKPPEPECHNGASYWNAPGSGFTTHADVPDALDKCRQYLSTKIPNLRW